VAVTGVPRLDSGSHKGAADTPYHVGRRAFLAIWRRLTLIFFVKRKPSCLWRLRLQFLINCG
jgi:hypothetical protein